MIKKIFSLFAAILFAGSMMAEVVSGTVYSTPSPTGVPSGWSASGNGSSYIQLVQASHFIQTEEFCQNGFTSIVLKARKYNGPSASQLVITVEWFENGGSSTVLGTVSPTSTSLTNYTISSPASVTGNKSGYIKISCKEASGGKGSGVSEVTINYTEGSCGGSTPTCKLPTFSPEAGTYEGTQNVTITSTAGATIYYTTDGTTPTTSSSVYSAAIPVAADMTIKAFAVKEGYDDSEVAEAAYVITEGPDVNLNLIDGKWGFPTDNTTTLKEYTNSASGYSISCYASNGYKISSSGYFIIGKANSYIVLPQFSNPIEKIVVVGNEGGSGNVKFNIFDGETPASTEVMGCATDQTFEIANPAANKQYTLKVTSAHNLQLKAIKIFYGEAPAIAKPVIAGEASFFDETEVDISCDTEGAAIYYTTDGSEPTASSTAYTAAFKLTESATVKAIAILGSDKSAIAEKTFTKAPAYASIEALVAAGLSTGSLVKVTFEDVEVTGIYTNGSDERHGIYFDVTGEKDVEIYYGADEVPEGWAIGGTVSGTINGTWTLFGSQWEIVPAGSEWKWSNLTYKASTVPAIIVATTSVNAPAAGKSGKIDVTYNNIDDFSALEVAFFEADGTTPASYAWVNTSFDSDKNVEYEVAANTGEARTAYLKVLVGEVASELITISQAKYVIDFATLPFAFNSGSSAIASTVGLTQSGLGSDYSSAPKLKFDGNGDYVILKINEDAGVLSFDIKGNGSGTSYASGLFKVQTSSDGESYTDLKTYTEVFDVQTEIFKIEAGVRYIKWIYVTKTSGNVALGNISVSKDTYSIAWSLGAGADENLGVLGRKGDTDSYAKYFYKDILTVGTYVVKVFKNDETTACATANLDIDEVAKYYVEIDYNASTGEFTAEIDTSKTGEPTSVDNTVDGKKAVKFIENGQLFIELNGHIYNVQGQTVK